MQKRLTLLSLLLFFQSISFSQLLSPGEFLPHRLGETFTPHHLLIDYFEHVAANSNKVKLIEYGRTYQERPLILAFVSSPENLARLEDIRKNNLRHTGLLGGATDPSLDRAIVWLSFSVHGNEAAGSESSMAVLHELVDPANEEAAEWLDNTIVIIDPSLNPDGYSRYTHWYRNVANRLPNPRGASREHDEPWPGGRVNHYLFDLNRDWAWQTQTETRQRTDVYLQWMPHVHPDIHEQSPDDPYYFAPAARPYHHYITSWQADFQVDIGKNHARYFDANGWLYFTREIFDLFYPGYGDTYPTFHGAIGMTYEQGGSAKAGSAYILKTGDTLTLSDRIDHHKTAALSTVEVSSENADQLLRNFSDYFSSSSQNPPGKYKTFIIKGSNPKGRLQALCSLLDRHQIRYGRAGSSSLVKCFDYQNGAERQVRVETGDLLISARQPLGIFTQVLMEPRSELEDSITYDITAWALPYAYGLEAYASPEVLSVQQENPPAVSSFEQYSPSQAYAYLSDWNALTHARFLSALFQKGIKVRYAAAGFQLDSGYYEPGTLVITRADNRKLPDFDRVIQTISEDLGQRVNPVQTGFTERGSDLGSDAMKFIAPPRIALLSGDATSAYSFGQLWYYFEQDLEYPVDVIEFNALAGIPLEEYQLLILPEGTYEFEEKLPEKMLDWIKNGGRLIAIGRAIRELEKLDGFRITRYATETEEILARKKREQTELKRRSESYGGRGRDAISNDISGAIFRVKMDRSHPLAYGLGDYYFSLKTDTLHYDLQTEMWNVGTIGEELMISGFAGARAKENMKNTVVFAVKGKEKGSIIYMIDNPLYRAFWENGKFLFSNAVFLVGQ